VSTRSLVTTALVFATLGFVSPVYAQEAAASGGGAVSTLVQWSVITAGFALAIAAAFGALGQGKAVSAAVEAIARNPSAAGDIRANLLLGLVLIESLVIYVLLIALILLFLGPFGAPTVS
jgi:F-type H+-transporting ATPase subunit c